VSRIRRPELHSRFFFITCCLRRGAAPLRESEFKILAQVFDVTRRKLDIALCGYCFMSDHWHVIVLPAAATSVSDFVMRIKMATARRIQNLRHGRGPLWQPRFHDHVITSRGEFDQTLHYIHMNPVRKNLVDEASAWRWSSANWYAGNEGPIAVDDVRLPLNPADRV
jgi:putative transposase